jgi:hypothetical protein
MTSWIRSSTISAVMVVIAVGVYAQAEPAPLTKAGLQREVARLKHELSECRGPALRAVDDKGRAEAIASLRAVKSALDGGANIETFRKYEIESRVKVDALPDTPGNQPLRDIAALYADALSFALVRISGSIEVPSMQAAWSKYEGDSDLKRFMQQMSAGDSISQLQHDLNVASAEAISKTLILNAEVKLHNMK